MATDIHDVTFSIKAVDGATAVFRQVKGAMGEVESQYMKLTRMFTGIAGAGVVAGIFTKMVAEVREAEVSNARFNAVLRATGNTAGITRDQMDRLAQSMSESTIFDDDAVKQGMTNFLKLGSIQREVFTEGIKLAGDFAALTGSDFASAAQVMGKALQSPVEGLRMLERELGQMSPAQERSIKLFMEQGDRIRAQGVVLDFVRGKIRGTADEMNNTLDGAIKRVTNSANDMIKAVGQSGPSANAAGVLTLLSAELKVIQKIFEAENWQQRAQLFFGLIRGDAERMGGSRLSVGKIGGLPLPPQEKTKEQLEREKDLAKEAKRLREENAKRYQTSEEAGMAGRYDAANDAYIAWGQIQLKALKDREALEEQMRKDDEAAWKAYYDDLAGIRDLATDIERETTLRKQQEALEAQKKMLKEANEFTRQAARNMQDAMGTFFFDVFERRTTDLAGSFRVMLHRMMADLAASKLSGLLFGDYGKSNQIGGLLGAGIGKLGGLFAQSSPMDLSGFGVPEYATGTDYVPRTGLALVHQGERITPAGQNNGGPTIVQNIQVGGNVTQADIPAILSAARQGAIQGVAELAGRSPAYAKSLQGR